MRPNSLGTQRWFTSLVILASLLMVCGLSTQVLVAQVLRSSITGRITDASGAVVPDVNVMVTNQQTGVVVRTTSNSSGNYTVPELNPGIYTVAADKTSFRHVQVTGLQLLAQVTVRQNLELQVGKMVQTVQVSGETPLINTENASISTPITSTQLRQLPTSSQDIDSFLVLAAGVGRATFNSSPQISGSAHWGADNFTLNGVSVNDPGNGGGSYSFGLGGVNLPALGSLQEVQVGGIDMDARYSRIVNVQMVTKAGTNQFHGEVYEYLENNALNANTFVANAARQPRSPFHKNEFGFNVGGPVLHNKAFFFFDYDGVRQDIPQTIQDNLPSIAEREGNFSALCATYNSSGVCTAAGGLQLYNPNTGQPFTGNVIPAGMITTQAQTLLGFMPPPTDTSSPGLPTGTKLPNGQAEQYNYTTSLGQNFHVNKWDLRLDDHLSDHDSLFGVYSSSVGLPWFDPLGTPPTYGNGKNYGYNTYTLSGTETHTFGPNSYNSLRLAWFDHESIRSGQNTSFNPYPLFPQLTPSGNRGLPTMTMSGYTKIGDVGLQNYTREYDVEITDDFTHVMGAHTLQAGMDETGFKVYTPGGGYTPLSAWAFNGTWTGNQGWPGLPHSVGNAFADFILGYANSGTTGSPTLDKVSFDRDWEFYAQDVWQMTRNLTVSYGLRYVYQAPWLYRDNEQTYFDFNSNSLVLPENSGTPTVPPGTDASLLARYPFTTTQAVGWPLTYFQPDKNNFAPRVGAAWRVFGSSKTVLRGGYGIYYNFNAAYIGFNQFSTNPPWTSTLTYNSGKPSSPKTPYLPDITFNQPFPSGTLKAPAANPTVHAMNQNYQNARIQQFTVTLEHQFSPTWMGRISYVGNRSVNLPQNQFDANLPVIQQPTVALQKTRPYQPWGTIGTTNDDVRSNTDQLQMEFQHKFAGGIFAQAQYSWTNCRDSGWPTVAGIEMVVNVGNDYGNCPYLARHQLVGNYVYNLPFGEGRHWLQRGPVSQILGGWSISGITTYQTGPPFTVTFTPPGTYPGWVASRADVVPGVNPYIKDHTHSPTATWLNPAAFVAPAPGQVGNSPRDGYWGPGFANWDMSLAKTIIMPFREKHHLQVRADFFNTFNHTNWDGGGISIGGVGAPVVAKVGTQQYGGLPVTNFGQVTTGEGNRVIQLSMQYTF